MAKLPLNHKHRVFISHAWEDKALVRQLEAELVAAGIETWVDHSSVRSGDILPKRISNALEWCSTLLLIWSDAASKSSWVELEWTNAVTLGKIIIPCILDEAPLPGILAGRVFIDFRSIDKSFAQLLSDLNSEAKPVENSKPKIERAITVDRHQKSSAFKKIMTIFIPAISIISLLVISFKYRAKFVGGTDRILMPATGHRVKVARSFSAPGETVTGITYDGIYLWLSDISGAIFKIDTSGRTLGAFSMSTPVSLAWDGSSFWMFTIHHVGPPWDVVYQLQIKEAQVKILRSFEATEGGASGSLLRNDLEWDGKSLWLSNKNLYNVFRIDTTGSILSHFAFPKRVTGVAWDGSYLWLAYNEDYFSPSTLSVVDTQGKIMNSFPSPVFDIESLAWGNKHLWAVGKDESIGNKEMIYQLDVSLAIDTLSPN